MGGTGIAVEKIKWEKKEVEREEIRRGLKRELPE